MYISSGGTLTLENGVFTLTKGSGNSNFYINIPKTSLPIADFIGKTLIVKTDITSINATYLRMSLFTHNGTSWSSAIIKDMTTTGLAEQSIDVPSNATQIRIRFDIYGNTDDNVVFKDFRFLFG